MEQRIFRSRIDALRREVMDACALDMLIAYSDDILSAGAVRYLTDFDMYAMYGLVIVPRRGDVVLAFGLHHSAYLVRVRSAAIADHYEGTYHPGRLCAELLADSRPAAASRVGVVGGAQMFESIHADIHANLGAVTYVDVDREFWSHYFSSMKDSGAEASLRRSAVIAGEALAHARAAFGSGQRSVSHLVAGAALAARRMGADIMNRELVQVLCATGTPLPGALSPVARHTSEAGNTLAIEITSPHAGQRSVCGRTLLRDGSDASATQELARASQVHAAILGLMRAGANGKQITAEAQHVARAAGFGLPENSELGHGIGLSMRQPHSLSADDSSLLAPGMAFAVRTRLQGGTLGTIHQADTVLVSQAGPEVMTARA